MERHGLVCIYTGNGKGKSTAAFGTALRAAGQGLKVLIVQFMKGKKNVGEINALKSCSLPIEIKQFGRAVLFQSRTCEAIDIKEAMCGIEAVLLAVESGSYDVIILDEVNVAIHFGLITADTVSEIIKNKPPALHLVLTGRCAPKRFSRIADLVTEMKEIKHPFSSGVQAQPGIEF